MKLLGMGGGLDFSDAGYRDVFLQGKCDEGCLQLAKLLGLEVCAGFVCPFSCGVDSSVGKADGNVP